MQLIFLNKNDLNYKDYGFVDSDFELVVDLVLPQKSSFMVNKENLNISIGDIAVLKEKNYSYVGLVETTEIADKGKTKVQCKDFKELFNIKVPIKSFTGDVANFLSTTISAHFINNSDVLQNLNYLKIDLRASKQGSLNFDDDNLMKITDLIEIVTKTYGINLHYKVEFIKGAFSKIVIIIDSTDKGIKLKSDFKAIRDLVINDSDEQIVNKVIYYPKSDNKTYKTTKTYYLLTNGDISENKNDGNRYKNVSLSSFYYSDNEYANLSTKARSEMIGSSLDHNITFSIHTNNGLINPLENLFLGDYIEFYAKQKVYDSVVTQIKFKNSFAEAELTLGEFRIKLTEKIKLLSKNMNSNIGNVAVSKGGVTDLDGGVF